MKISKTLAAAVATLALAGCVSGERVQFIATADQRAIIRDGRPALVSRKKNSIILIGPAGRQLQAGVRPVFVVGATNLTREPTDLRVANITIKQLINGQESLDLPVITYEQLVNEEQTRQVIGALLVGAAAGANAYSASRAGYGSSYSTVRTPNGVATVQTNYFSPTANAIAQANASAQNDAMISSTIENGQRNMAALEQGVLKDNTIMPGEWIGGQLHFVAPQGEMGQTKQYRIAIALAGETHVIDVSQEPMK